MILTKLIGKDWFRWKQAKRFGPNRIHDPEWITEFEESEALRPKPVYLTTAPFGSKIAW